MECKCELCKNNIMFQMPEEILSAYANQKLVLFCGAGVSTEGKNVLRSTFYTSICEELGIGTDQSFCEVMSLYCTQPNGRNKLLKKILERMNYVHSFKKMENRATRFHHELAPLYNIKTIITTNWDRYFEENCSAIPLINSKDVAFWDCCDRRVIKIHGSIDNLGSIVATKEDYLASAERLHNGIIGSILKSIILTSTIVFIGFSFGDEDFAQILDFIQDEMGEVSPHIYVVTLDRKLSDRLTYKNSSVIITDGSHFLHSLKNELYSIGQLDNLDAERYISLKEQEIKDIHHQLSVLDYRDHPEIIYCLTYQDGVLDAFDRYFQTKNTGEYNQPGYIYDIAPAYQKMIDDYIKAGDYLYSAYFEGYLIGLCFITNCDDKTLRDEFPIYFLYNSSKELTTFDVFMEELTFVESRDNAYKKLALKILEEKAYDHTFEFNYNPF